MVGVAASQARLLLQLLLLLNLVAIVIQDRLITVEVEHAVLVFIIF